MSEPAPHHAGLINGLSRMMGNYHVRFLGEGASVMALPYPTSQLPSSIAQLVMYFFSTATGVKN